jgi:hypothetical protein
LALGLRDRSSAHALRRGAVIQITGPPELIRVSAGNRSIANVARGILLICAELGGHSGRCVTVLTDGTDAARVSCYRAETIADSLTVERIDRRHTDRIV